MTTQPMLYRRGDQLRILPRRTPDNISAVIAFGQAARLGRRDSRLPERQRAGYHRQDFTTASGRHRLGH
ncbi:hypothetical protein [Nocardia fluminea]|uniref:Uncharacterized protein n=1 Tax=Nocardia fluminea TaxID=134984 RepID=A0A2N3WXQ2_9NOCA|nr:hypothetical protein [Nocardia fluminea]PKV98656.1 hypothetical protein ATK86_0678 [Nocardia fluminea]